MLYTIQNSLRLCRKTRLIQNKRYNHISATNEIINKPDAKTQNKQKDFQSLLKEYKDKITFNSYLDQEKLRLGNFKYYIKSVKRAENIQKKEYNEKCSTPLPLSLQYYVDKDRLLTENSQQVITETDNTFQLPFANTTHIDLNESEKDDKPTFRELKIVEGPKEEFDRSNIDKWMTSYECFDDNKLNIQEDSDDDSECVGEWSKYYGTPDLTARISKVPCGGCGALLHCNDVGIPGYLPSEIYKMSSFEDLMNTQCQRCHFLKEYNIALDVSVHPEEYEQLLQSIKHIKSMVVLMVDLLDFPCSIWPGIVDIIGTKRPIIIVGNKVDLLPGDSIGYLKRIKESLISEINKTDLGTANIKYVSLISAKTGYGVEDLISALFKLWVYKGDVFLVGCTNVGKSSLFNALLQSDYCKVHAVDIVQRATVSRWPGTTLNLLKFPINRISGWKIYERTRRLQSERKIMKVEKEIRDAQVTGKTAAIPPALIGHIGRSFFKDERIEGTLGDKHKLTILDEKHRLLARSKWFYDTPGVVHPDQVLSLLSTEELLVTIPKNIIRPQTYYLNMGSTILIGGLARIDHIHSPEPCRFSIFCADTLPITVLKTEDADEIYDKFLGTELFAAPLGGEERLKAWPGLKKHDKIFVFHGTGPKLCCGDIVLSSVGWVSITAKVNTVCKVAAWTPEGRGIYNRTPSLLQYAVNLKGKRLRDTPAYMVGNVFKGDK